MGSIFKRSMVLILAVWALLSCESPVQAGLGNRVDINPPTLSVLSPKAGLFLHDLVTFRVKASDDIKVEGVYVRAAMEVEFKTNPPEWISIAPAQGEANVWSWQKTTRNEEDGIFVVQFRAVDNSRKYTETENLVYTIKNLPPRVDLNIPNFSLKDRTRLQSDELSLARNGFSIDSGGVLIGYATDIQGVAFQSPKIKFWREGEPRPADWSELDVPDWDFNGDGAVDRSDQNSPQAVSKGREFRYYMTNHGERDENNRPVNPRAATPLPVGDYRLQLWVSDTGVNEEGQPNPISTVFPPVHTIDGVEYDSILIHVTPSYETPKLELQFTPSKTYQNESFLAQAKAFHSSGIESVDLKVRRSGEMALHSLKWESNTENLFDTDPNGVGVKSRSLESFFIIPGGYYPETGGGTFLFDSGAYEFEIQANSKAGATVRSRQTIYIDNTPPSALITQIDPGTRIRTENWGAASYAGKAVLQQDAAHNIPEAYIVNGKVTIVVSAKDSNGLGSGTDATGAKEIRFLRYLLVKANFADPAKPGAAELEGILPRAAGTWNASSNGLNPDLIYDADVPTWTARGIGAWKSGFLDELPNVAGENDIYSRAIDTITLDTRRIFGPLNPGSSDTGELYLFIAAKDQAGNLASLTDSASTVIGYHLHVDQGDDKPYVVFTDIKDTVSAPAVLQGAYDNIMESTVRIRGTLEDDDGILVGPDSAQFRLLRESEFLDNIDDSTQEKTVPFNAELPKGRKGRSLSFNFSRQDLGAAYGGDKLPDGVYRLTVLVWDDPNEKDGVPSISNSLTEPVPPLSLKPVWFGIDGDSPVFEKITPQNNEFAGDNFTMEVAVSDANGPLHLEVRTPQSNGAAPLKLPEKLQYWDIDYLRWISDPANAGKWFNSDPAVGTDGATNFNLGKYGKDRLDALIADPSVPGISSQASLVAVLNTILSDIDSIAAPASVVAGGKTTTTYKFHIKNIDNDTPPHLTVGLSAQDRFLKKTDRILAVKLDKEKPHIWINNGSAETRWFQGMGSINGTAWDPYATAEGAMPETTLTEALDAAAAAHGAVHLMYYKKVRWTGNPLAAPPAPPLPAVGGEAAEGWVPVKMEFPDDPKSGWSVIIGDPAAADPSLGVVEPEGIYTLYLYAVDQAGNRGPGAPAKFQSYGLDKSAPVIGDLLIGGTPPAILADPPHRAAHFYLKGTVKDTFALASFSVAQSKDGGTPTVIPIDPPLDPGSINHAWSSNGLPRKADGSVITTAELTSGAYDGVYTYTFALEDRSGRRAGAQRVVYLDTKKPKIEVSSPASLDTANPGNGKRAFFATERIEFTGSATDDAPGTVSRIMYYDAYDTGAAPPPLSDPLWKSGAAGGVSGTNVWRIAADLGAAAGEGNRRIWIVAEDKMGHRNSELRYKNSDSGGGVVTAASFPYAYDKEAPQLTETSIGSGGKWVASAFTLDGLAGDSNALKSLVITQTKTGDDKGDYTATITLINDENTPDPNLKGLLYPGYSGSYPGLGNTKWPKPGTNWSTSQRWMDGAALLSSQPDLPVKSDGTHVPNTDSHKSGSYRYVIVATDISGRAATLERNVIVDYEPPALVLSDTAFPPPAIKWFQGTAGISGRVWDPSASGQTETGAGGVVSNLYYRVDSLNAVVTYPSDSTEAALWSQTPMNFPNTAKSPWNLTLDKAEGKYSLYLYAVDAAGNKSPLARQNFGIDKTPPALDDIIVDNSITGNFATGGAASASPVDLDSSFNLKGSITEAMSGIALFRITQSKDGGAPLDITGQLSVPAPPAVPSTGWELPSLPRKNDTISLSPAELTSGAYDGVYVYTFTVIDAAGHLSHSTTVTRVVNLDTQAPAITVNAPSSINPASPGDGKRAFFTTPNIDISGVATDASPGKVVNIYYYDADDATQDAPGFPGAGWKSGVANGVSGTSGWRINTSIAASGEGNRKLWIIAEDQLGHTSKKLVYTNSSSAGGSVENSGRYLPYSYDRRPPLLTETTIRDAAKTVKGEFTLDGMVGDSNALKSLVITQTKTGDANGDYQATINLINNAGAPDANLVKLGYPEYAGKYPLPGASPWQANTNWSTDHKWEDGAHKTSALPKLPLDKNGNWVKDTDANKSGAYQYTIIATDITDRTTTVERDVLVDITPPTVALGSVVRPDNAWYESDASIKGTASDDAPGVVDVVYYWIGSRSASAPSRSTVANLEALWRKADGVGNWTVYNITTDSATSTPLAEGEYHLCVLAVDRAGNIAAPLEYNFRIDRTAPAVVEKTPAAAAAHNAAFDLVLDIAETYALGKIDIKQTFTPQGSATAGAPVTVTKTTGVEHKTGAAISPYTLSGLPYKNASGDVYNAAELSSGSCDGTYAYEITVYDQAAIAMPTTLSLPHHAGAFARTVSIDTKPPQLVVNSPRNSPSQPAFISSSKLFLTGHIADAHPGPVYFWDGPETDAPASTPATIAEAETAIASPATGWHKAAGSPPAWTIDYTLPGTIQEGARHVMLIVFDTLGRKNTNITYRDDNNNATSAGDCYFPYAVDTSAPQLSEFTGNDLDRKAMPASFHLNGVVGDSNGVRSLTITQTLVGDSDPEYNFTYELFNIWDDSAIPPAVVSGGKYLLGPKNGLNKPWDTGHYFSTAAASVAQPAAFSLPLKRTVDGQGKVAYAHADGRSGDFDYAISATDKYGRTTAIVRRVQVDVEPPEVSLRAAPANKPENSWFDATATIRGNGSDALSGIRVVYYWLGKGTISGGAYTPPVPPRYDTLQHIEDKVDAPKRWDVASGDTSWTVPLDISESAFEEGYYTLYVIAVDGAGNIGGKKTGSAPNFAYPALSYHFRVDKGSPTVTETRVDPAVNVVYAADNKSPLRKGSFDLNAKLQDSHGVSRLVVKQKTITASVPAGTTVTILDKTYAASPVSVDEPLGNLPWNAANGDGSFSSAATAADGIYEYEFTVYDLTSSDSEPANRKTGAAKRVITVDKTKPKAHISDPADGYQTLSSQMVIRGSSTDAFPGTDREIWYWTGAGTGIVPGDVTGIDDFNAVNKTAGKWQKADGGIPAEWNKTIALGDAEGYRRVAVVAVDRHENVSDIKYFVASTNEDQVSVRYFSKDNAPPALDENIIDTRGKTPRNPRFTMGGSATDTNGVEKIVLKQTRIDVPGVLTVTLNLNTNSADKNKTQYWLFKDLPYTDTNGSQTSIVSGTGLVGAAPITFTPTTPYTGSGVFDYVITLYDVSGRVTVEERHVTIDTQPPTVTLSAPPANPAPGSWLSATTIIKGSASDSGANNSGVDLVYFWHGNPASPPDASSYANKAAIQASPLWTSAAAGAGGAFAITLPVSGTTFAEGKYQLLVLALDLAGNIGGTTNVPATTAPVSYLFGVDKAAPVADELSASAPAADLHKTALFSLGGTLYDSFGIANYENVRITQAAGSGSPVTVKAYGTNSSGSVAGYSEAASHASIPGGRPAGTRWWELANLPRDPASVGSAMTPLADGKYTYTITVKDNADKETVIKRVVWLDRTAPAAAITSPTELVNEKWYDGASISITGTAADPAPSSGIDAVYIWYGSGNAATPPALSLEADGSVSAASAGSGWARAGIIVDTGNAGSATWNSGSYSLSGEGPRTVAVFARDKAGHMNATAAIKTFWVDNTAPALLNIAAVDSPRNSAFALSGQGWDSNGLKSVSVTQKKLGVGGANAEVEIFSATTFGVGSGTGSGLDASNAASWAMAAGYLPRQQTAGYPYALEDGEYTYTITLTDKSGRTATQTRTVLVDTSAAAVSGGASDIAISYPQLPVVDGEVNTWVSGKSLTIKGTAKDHDRSADSNPPAGTLTPSGIAKVLCYASHNLSANPADPTGPDSLGVWKAANYDSSTRQWNATFDLADFSLAAGTNKLWIRVYDNAGNLSGAYTRIFGVDQDDPAVAETTVQELGLSPAPPALPPPSFSYARESNFTLAGTVTETNIDRIVITQHVRNVDLSYVTSAPVTIATLTTAAGGGITGSSPDKKWTLPQNSLPRKFAADGVAVDVKETLSPAELDKLDKTFIYTITAYDLAGKVSNVVTRTVAIDKTGPEVAIAKPAALASFQNSVIEISGTASDGTEVKSVYYRVTETPVDAAAADTTLSAIAPVVNGKRTYAVSDTVTGSALWSKAEGTVTWSRYVDFSTYFSNSISEGALTLWVIAADLGKNYGANSSKPGDPARVDFTLDQNPPVIGALNYNSETGYQNITRLNKNSYANGDFSFSFDVWDTNGLAATDPVVVRRNGTALAVSASDGVTVTAQAHPTLTGITAAKNRRVVVRQKAGSGGLADGSYTYTITATDLAKKTTERTVTIVVDTVKPDLTIDSIVPLVTENTGGIERSNVNGLFWFKVNAMDVDSNIFPYQANPTTPDPDTGTNGSVFGGVKYYLAAVPAAGHPLAKPFEDSGGVVLTQSVYRGAVDSATLTDGADYVLWVYARDGAGNTASTRYVKDLRVKQATDLPVVTIPAMGAPSSADAADGIAGALNLDPQNKGYPITGFVADDDNVDALADDTKLLFSISQKNPAGLAAATWTLIPYSSSAAQGKAQKERSTAGSDKNWNFTYTVPQTFEDGDYLFKVVAQDKDKAFPYTQNQAPAASLTTPAAAKAERVYRLSVDKEAPVITVTGIENTYKTSRAITGTLKEAKLKAFKVSLDGNTTYNAFDSNGSPKTSGELLLSGAGETKNWTLTIPAADFNALKDGPHSLLWSAEDMVGNPGSAGKSFYKDSTGPDINFTNINEDQMFIIKGQDANMAAVWHNPKVGGGEEAAKEPLLKAAAEVITDGNPKLTGAFSDEFSTVFESTAAADIKFWYRFDAPGASTSDIDAWTEATGATYIPNFEDLKNAPAKTVRWQLPLASLGQGYHTVDIKVLDRWGSENGLTVKASANDPAGGKYYKYERVAFRLDSEPPVISVPSAPGADKALVNGATFGTHGSGDLMFTLKADVKDVTLSEVSAKIYVGNSTVARHTFALGSIVDGAEKKLTINSAFTETNMSVLLAAAAAAGEKSNIFKVEIVAVDGAPRQTLETLQFKMDGAPPTITTGNLITDRSAASYPTVVIDALPAIQGNISDDSGIGEATYSIEKWDYSSSAWQNVINAQDQNLSATNFANEFVTMEAFTINLGSAPLNLADGKYRISFNLKDKASPVSNQAAKINGTVDDINEIVFFIDRATPALSAVQFKSPPFYSGAEVKEGTVDYMAVYLNASDDNTITQIRARLETDAAGTYPLTAALNASVSGANYRLLIPKDTYAEGLHTLTLEAKDGAGRTTTITRDFTLDKTLPMLQIIEPMPAVGEPHAEISSEATIRGITVDNTSVSKLYYLFGRTEIANGTVAAAGPTGTTAVINGKIWREFSAGINKDGATIAASSYTSLTATSDLDKAQGGGSLYNWTIRLPNSVDLAAGVNSKNPNGTYVSLHNNSAYLCDLPVRFMMIDSAGNTATYDYTVVVNPKGDEPTVNIAAPSPANTAAQNEVGGVITVVGAAKDNDWIHRVVFRVIDGDEPDTASPKNHPVYDASGDGYALDTVTNDNYAKAPHSDSRGGWRQAPIVGTPGSNVQWSVNLNNNGGLNAPAGGTRVVTIQVLAYDTPAANHNVAQTMGEPTRVKVTFVDGLPFVVDNTVIITPDPKNGVPFKYDDPVANKRVGGTVTIKARIRDDNGLKELAWHGEETTQYGSNILKMDPGAVSEYAKPLNAVQSGSLSAGVYYMWLAGGTRTNVPFLGSNPPAGLTWAAPALNHDGAAYADSSLAAKAYLDYELSLVLDTTKLANKAGYLARKAGSWILSILATDHTDFKMPANWSLQIDNYHPLGTYTGNGVAAGNNYQLQGLAWDTGAGVTVQGIKKVVAWFSRGPVFVPLNEREAGATFKATAEAVTVAHGRTDTNKDNTPSSGTGNWNTGLINDGTSPIKSPDLTYTRKYLADGTTLNPAYYKTNAANEKFISGIEIDKNEPTADNDEDGFLEGMADAGNNFQWYARIDTTRFLDGLLTVHYLVYDHAGNTSYYSHNIFISNNPPKVTGVEIGTDILGTSSTEDPRGRRTVSANYGNTNITARNKRLSFRFSMQGDTGAKPFHYRFGYVSSRTPTAANALTVGQIYAITAVGTVNWEAVGAPVGYGVGTTFMATDTTSFGTGSADLLTMSAIQSDNIDSKDLKDHVFSYTYMPSDFGSGTGQIPDATGNNAWFVLRVYNSLKIPMEPDTGATANNGMSQTGAGGINVYAYGSKFQVWDQPFDVVRIGLNVVNDDTVKPEVKLWDFNPAGETAGVNGLNGLALNANGAAAQPPSSIDLSPNTAKSPNLLKGGLYNPRNNNRIIERSGHIEPRHAANPGAGNYFIDGNYGSTTFSKDTLSGEVIVRGFAYDDQRLGAVYLRIDSPSTTGTEFKILQSDDSSTYNPANPGNRGLLVPVSGQPAFAYNQIGVEGHIAEWAYVWNTVSLPANFVAGDNVKIQVRVEDKRSAPNSSALRPHPNTGETANGTTILNGTNNGRYPLVLRNADGWRLDKAPDLGYNRIAVTLAPYLNSFQRDAAKGYSSLRSRQGWYSFSRGETIVAQGWNLKYPSGNTTVSFDTATATVAAAVSAQTPKAITFTAPATAVSGDVVLVANGVSTVNDRNDNRNPWNRDDYNLSLSGTELWIDDRAAHVWAADAGTGNNTIDGSDRMQINGSETPKDPALTMAPKTGKLWASWANTANAAVYMNTNQGTDGRIELLRNSGGGGQLTTTDIYFAEPQRSGAGNNVTHPTVFYHSNRIYGNNYSVANSGGLKGYDPQGGGRFDYTTTGESHQYNVELTYHNQLNTQFEGYHRVVYRNNAIHVSYYDNKDKSIKYWFGKSGYFAATANYVGNTLPALGNLNGLDAPGRHWMNLDGGSDAEDASTPSPYSHRVRPGTSGTEGAWNFTRASMAGPWSSIDLRSGGEPVIAYFDAEHSTLRLAVASVAHNPQVSGNNAGALPGNFIVQYAMMPSDLNYSFAGEYVSMQIDQTNNDAHLAFFRSNSTQLIYLKLKWTGSKYEPYGPSVIIDESSANGKWVDLALDRQNRPWISYQDLSRAGNFDGVKMAYYDPSAYETSGKRSYDTNGVEKTGWETMNVPTLYKASDNRTGIEVWPHRDTPASVAVTKTWAAAVGYTNPDYYRIAYYLKPRN